MKHYKPFIILFFFSYIATFSQNNDSTTFKISKPLLWTLYGSAYTTSMTALYFIWYDSYEKSSFHWFDDAKEWKQMDKCGHLFSTYQLNKITHQTMLKAGYTKQQSLLYSALLSFSLMNSIEVFDGFSKKWGASATDLLSNAAGIVLFYSQELAIQKQVLSIKFSYHFTPLSQYRPDALGKTIAERILKDYNGQTYWLNINLHNIFHTFKPRWLNISLGYSAYNMLSAHFDKDISEINHHYLYTPKPFRQYFISLDLQADKIHTRYAWLNRILSVFSCIKIPFPAVELNKYKAKFHFIYF